MFNILDNKKKHIICLAIHSLLILINQHIIKTILGYTGRREIRPCLTNLVWIALMDEWEKKIGIGGIVLARCVGFGNEREHMWLKKRNSVGLTATFSVDPF